MIFLKRSPYGAERRGGRELGKPSAFLPHSGEGGEKGACLYHGPGNWNHSSFSPYNNDVGGKGKRGGFRLPGALKEKGGRGKEKEGGRGAYHYLHLYFPHTLSTGGGKKRGEKVTLYLIFYRKIDEKTKGKKRGEPVSTLSLVLNYFVIFPICQEGEGEEERKCLFLIFVRRRQLRVQKRGGGGEKNGKED